MNVANVILMAVSVFCIIIGLMLINALSDDICKAIVSLYTGSYDNMSSYGYGYYGYPHSDFSNTLTNALFAETIAAAVMASLNIALGIALIMSAAALAAALISMRLCDQPSKLGMVFGWSIAGAICSFLSMGIPQTALFVLTAVFAYKDKKAFAGKGQR